MGRPSKKPLDEVIEQGVRDQIRLAENWRDRQQALNTGIKFMAVKARIEMPDEGSGFSDGNDKGEGT
jgi:hypothetical protein